MKINPQDNISLHPRYHLWTVLSLLFFLSIPLGTYSQEKDLSSLIPKKNELENRPGFKETDTNYIKVIYKLARGLRYRNPDSTKILSEKAIALSEPQNYTKGIAGGKLGLGIFHVLRGNFEEGFHNTDQAIELAKSIHADTIHLRGINTNAVGHFLNGDYPQTYILCKEGESLSENTGNNEMLITFVTNLATCFSLLEEYEQALIYYKKASALLKDSNNQAELSRIQCNIAYTHLQIGQYDEGKKYCDLAIKGFQNDGFVAFEAYPDFPESPIMAGASFHRPELEQLEEIAHWFANGRALLETLRADWGTMSELRVWPHHFDLGALLPIDGDKMLGIGLSPGDQTYEQPYFYCSPYPQPASHDGLPPLQVGKWHTDGFVSAVLTGEMLQGVDQAAVASAYLAEAVRACRELVG